MADVTIAINYVLKQEDSTLSGRVTSIPGDRGGRTRFGVAEKYHPELTKTGFFDTMSSEQALIIAINVYKSIYTQGLNLTKIQSQAIANALLSLAVNAGIGEAVKLAQKTLGLSEDGKLGEVTLDGLNETAPLIFLKKFGEVQNEFYVNLASKYPEDGKFLTGWLNRVKQNCILWA